MLFNELLLKSSTASILAAAGKAAALDLPIEPSLGQAYIVPYGGEASFQIGYRGIIALAQRSALMKSIVMTPVFRGEINNWNRFTETPITIPIIVSRNLFQTNKYGQKNTRQAILAGIFVFKKRRCS